MTLHLPMVSLCLATSLDGKISAEPGRPPNFTSRADRERLFRLRAEADILMMGANTVREEELAPLIRDPALVEMRQQAGNPDHPAAVIVSGSLGLPWRSDYFRRRQQEIFVLTGQAKAKHRVIADELGLTLLETGNPLSLANGLARLANLGFENLLAEGGGRLTHALLQAKLVTRLYLTIAPVIIGGERTPVLCNGPILDPIAGFKLDSSETVGDEIHAVYIRRSA